MQTTLSLLLLVGGASAFRSPATAVSPSTRLALSRSPAFARQPPAVASSSALPVPAPAPKTPGAGRTRALFSGISVFALSLLLPALALASGSGEHLHLGQKVALYFQKFGLPDWATLALISMVPAVELRGGVPVGNWMGMSPYSTFGICILGNMAPILPTLLALRSPFVKKLAAPLLKRAEKKLAGLPTGQSRFLALALFVGTHVPQSAASRGGVPSATTNHATSDHTAPHRTVPPRLGQHHRTSSHHHRTRSHLVGTRSRTLPDLAMASHALPHLTDLTPLPHQASRLRALEHGRGRSLPICSTCPSPRQ